MTPHVSAQPLRARGPPNLKPTANAPSRYANNRELRERAWRAWTRRGELSPERDNVGLVKSILKLRSEQAALHGKASFGAFQTEDMMAKSPDRVSELLLNVWPRARAAAEAERASLEAFSGLSPIEPWDWRLYAERLRAEQFAFDDAALKPFMSLPAMQRAVFDVANKLFGLRFVRRADVAAYHADCEVYEVRETVDGADELVGIFIADNFARPNKQGGAWMSELRTASRDGERTLPIICNNNNFSRGDPALLTFDDATTLFHEFGHGLHGLLSAATYRGLAGTSVLRDFVEMPSQLLENWLSEPSVLREHARHFETGEVVPDALLEKLRAAKTYGSGFATVEYTSCALIDQALHALPAAELETLDVNAFETATLERLGMPQGIVLRHRLPHFSHLFASSSYASAYYVYLWCGPRGTLPRTPAQSRTNSRPPRATTPGRTCSSPMPTMRLRRQASLTRRRPHAAASSSTVRATPSSPGSSFDASADAIPSSSRCSRRRDSWRPRRSREMAEHSCPSLSQEVAGSSVACRSNVERSLKSQAALGLAEVGWRRPSSHRDGTCVTSESPPAWSTRWRQRASGACKREPPGACLISFSI